MGTIRIQSTAVPDREMHLFRRDDEAFLFDPATSSSFGLDAPGEAAARLVIAAGWGVPAADDRAIRAALSELQGSRGRGHFGSPGRPCASA